MNYCDHFDFDGERTHRPFVSIFHVLEQPKAVSSEVLKDPRVSVVLGDLTGVYRIDSFEYISKVKFKH